MQIIYQLKVFTSLLFLLSILSFGQKNQKETNSYKDLEGIYNFSEFEVMANAYFLENKKFYFIAVFGNVDLEIFGTYELVNKNEISLQVDNNLDSEFFFYGRHDPSLKEELKLTYFRPYAEKAEHLFVKNSDNNLVKFDFEQDDISTLNLKIPDSRNIQIMYTHPETLEKVEYNQHLPKGINEVLIYHNYYSEMISQLVEKNWIRKKGSILSPLNNKTLGEKSEMTEEIRIQMMDYLEKANQNKTWFNDEKEFQNLN